MAEQPDKIKVLYRTDGHTVGPRSIKMEIPGWSGEKEHGDGAHPQPWHCLPWMEGSTYGVELLHPWEEFCISTREGKLVVEGDDPELKGHKPFKLFAPGHYGYGCGLDIQVPPGHILRLEPHPRFFIDTTGTVPLVVPGHIQTEWWTRTFFIVFKAPEEGRTHIFRKGEPYGQVLILPHRVKYDIREMTPEEAEKRIRWERISYHYDPQIGRRAWTAADGHRFNDKYKAMARAWQQEGAEGIEKLFQKAAIRAEAEKSHAPRPSSKVTGRFVKVKKKNGEA